MKRTVALVSIVCAFVLALGPSQSLAAESMKWQLLEPGMSVPHGVKATKINRADEMPMPCTLGTYTQLGHVYFVCIPAALKLPHHAGQCRESSYRHSSMPHSGITLTPDHSVDITSDLVEWDDSLNAIHYTTTEDTLTFDASVLTFDSDKNAFELVELDRGGAPPPR